MHFSEAAVNGWFALVPLIIAFPVAGLLVNLALGRRLGERFTGFVASAAVALAFGVAVLQWLGLQQNPQGARILVADWIAIGGLSVPWAIKVDTLSVTMMLMVTGVSTLIHVYATGYMHDDVRFQGDPGRYTRFFIFFNLFVAAMMILISGDSFLTLFVGWEGVGLCSYLLIGFWYEKGKDGIGNAVAGKKAFVANRIGDFGFLIAMFLTFGAFGSLTFDTVFEHAEAAGPQAGLVITLITLFLLLGAAGKSAQLPLYVWLPDAMAGPTPVSALIHAATMVTAGVYMITRTHVLFHLAPVSSSVVAIVGAATALLRRHDRRRPVRHQEGAGVFDHQPAGLHGGGGRDGRLCRRHVPPGDARLLQGAAVPRGRLGHPGGRARPPPRHASARRCARRALRPAGHAQHGRHARRA